MKARDIIPGWPRGRSTSFKGAQSIPFARKTFELLWITYWSREQAAAGFGEESLDLWEMERTEMQAEERRKADMMEGWYAVERVQTRFSFEPDNYLERHQRKYLRRWVDKTEPKP